MAATFNCEQVELSQTIESVNTVHSGRVTQVWISQSSDVFSNLALEDWLYRHHDFEHKRLLLLWRNDPCVVIGRHQNPWTETDVPYLRGSYIDLARRCLNYQYCVTWLCLYLPS